MDSILQSYCLQSVKRWAIANMFVLSGVHGVQADSLTVFAAASLRDAVQEISAQYALLTGDDPVLVFAATSAIARQVAQGAPADIVLLADRNWAEWLTEQGGVIASAPFAGNRLVIMSTQQASLGSIDDVVTALGDDVLAMAQVAAVPAGRYGKAALEAEGLWGVLSPQIVQAANVRAALRFVERGEAPFGIGYASDLVALPDLREVYRFAPDTHPPIVYVAVQVTPEGANFMTFLQSDAAKDVLQDWGFSPAIDLP